MDFPKKQAVVLLSGGLKSAVLAADLKHQGYEIRGIFFNYHQRMLLTERAAAKRVAEHLQMALTEIEISSFHDLNEDRTEGWTILDEERAAETVLPAIPGLISSMLILAAIHAGRHSAQYVAIGARQGDLSFPEASRMTMAAMENLFSSALSGGLRILSPYLTARAEEIVRRAQVLMGGKSVLPLTESCYGVKKGTCGACKGCKNRAGLFKAAGVPDEPRTVVLPKKEEDEEDVEEILDKATAPQAPKPAAPKALAVPAKK